VAGCPFLYALNKREWEERIKKNEEGRDRVIVCSNNWNNFIISLIYSKFIGHLPFVE
jgi:hypothetical protein